MRLRHSCSCCVLCCAGKTMPIVDQAWYSGVGVRARVGCARRVKRLACSNCARRARGALLRLHQTNLKCILAGLGGYDDAICGPCAPRVRRANVYASVACGEQRETAGRACTRRALYFLQLPLAASLCWAWQARCRLWATYLRARAPALQRDASASAGLLSCACAPSRRRRPLPACQPGPPAVACAANCGAHKAGRRFVTTAA